MAVQAVTILNIGDERLMSVQEAAEHLKCGRHLIYQLMDIGILKYLKIGRERRPKYSSLCKMLHDYENQDIMEVLNLSSSPMTASAATD